MGNITASVRDIAVAVMHGSVGAVPAATAVGDGHVQRVEHQIGVWRALCPPVQD